MFNSAKVKVGDRIVITDPWLTGGRYTEGSEGVVLQISNSKDGIEVKFDSGTQSYVAGDEYKVSAPLTPLETAKIKLAGTQRIYDEASEALDSAKAAFKLADEAHGKAIEAYNVEYLKEARKFTEADVKNFMTVKVQGHDELRIMHITDEDIRFYEPNGRIANRTSRDFLINCLNRNYEKTDLTITA